MYEYENTGMLLKQDDYIHRLNLQGNLHMTLKQKNRRDNIQTEEKPCTVRKKPMTIHDKSNCAIYVLQQRNCYFEQYRDTSNF